MGKQAAARLSRNPGKPYMPCAILTMYGPITFDYVKNTVFMASDTINKGVGFSLPHAECHGRKHMLKHLQPAWYLTQQSHVAIHQHPEGSLTVLQGRGQFASSCSCYNPSRVAPGCQQRYEAKRGWHRGNCGASPAGAERNDEREDALPTTCPGE